MGDKILDSHALTRPSAGHRATCTQMGHLPSLMYWYVLAGRLRVTLLRLLVSEHLFTLKNFWGPPRAFVYVDYTIPPHHFGSEVEYFKTQRCVSTIAVCHQSSDVITSQVTPEVTWLVITSLGVTPSGAPE